MAVLRSLSVLLSMNATQFKRETGKVDRRFKKLSRNFQKNSKKMTRSLSSIGIAMGVVAVVGRKLLAVADSMQLIRNQLGAILPNAQMVGEAMENITKIALASRQSLTSVGGLYARIALSTEHLGLSAEKTARVVALFANTLKLSGGGAAQTKAAILQFGQALAGGRVHAEEFNSILEANPKFAIEMAKHLKGTRGMALGTSAELRRLVKLGGVTAQMLIDFSTDAEVGYLMQQKVTAMTWLFSDALTNLTTRFEKYTDRIMRSTKISAIMTKGVKWLADNFREIANKVIPAAVIALASWATYMAASLALTVVMAVVALPALIKQFAITMAMGIVGWITKMWKAMAALTAASIVLVVQGLALLGAFYALIVLTQAIVAAFKDMGVSWSSIFTIMGDVLSSYIKRWGASFKHYWYSLKGQVLDFAQWMVDKYNAVMAAMGKTKLNLSFTENIVENTALLAEQAATWKEGIAETAVATKKAMLLLNEFGSKTGEALINIIRNDLEQLKSIPGLIGTASMDFINGVLDSVADALGLNGDDEEGPLAKVNEGLLSTLSLTDRLILGFKKVQASIMSAGKNGETAIDGMTSSMRTNGDIMEAGAAKSRKVAAIKKGLLMSELVMTQAVAMANIWKSGNSWPVMLAQSAMLAARFAMIFSSINEGGGSLAGLGGDVDVPAKKESALDGAKKASSYETLYGGGKAHDGLDFVPREGTYLLDKGERVLDSRLNGDLRDFMSQGGGGGGSQPLTIQINGVSDPDVVMAAMASRRGDLETLIRRINLDSAGQTGFGS